MEEGWGWVVEALVGEEMREWGEKEGGFMEEMLEMSFWSCFRYLWAFEDVIIRVINKYAI